MRVYGKLLWISVLLSADSVFAGDVTVLARENGLLENTQVGLLLLSAVVFAVQAFRMRERAGLLLWMGMWFCLSAILREVDVEDLSVPQWMVLVGSGTGRNLMMGGGWILLFLFGVKSTAEIKCELRCIIRSRAAMFMYAAGAMLLLAALSEDISYREGQLIEEFLETIGYSLLLVGSLFCSSILKKRAERSLL